jgi:hypothetical protein
MSEPPGYPSQYPPRPHSASGSTPQDGWFDGAQGDPHGAAAPPDPYAPRNGAYGAGQQPSAGGQYGAPAQDQYAPQAQQYGSPTSGAGTYGSPTSGGTYGSAPGSGAGTYGSAPGSGAGTYGSYGGGAGQDQYAPPSPTYGSPGGDQYGAPGQYGSPGGGQYGAPDQYGAPGQYASPGGGQYGAPDQYGSPGGGSYGPSGGGQYGGQYGAPAEAPGYGGAADRYGAPPSAPAGFGAPPQEPWQQSAMPGQQPSGGRNGLAIASFICGLIGLGLFGLIFGVIALSQIKKRNQSGRGLAIGGILLSVLWFVVGVALVVWAVMAGTANRNDAGEITEGGSVSSFDLKPGDCLNGLAESNNITSVPAVPCTEPHDGEVFATFEITAGTWPGDAEVAKQAETGCVQRLPEYSEKAAKDEKLEIFFLHPTSASWAQGDHEVTCVAMGSAKTTGSIKD